MSEKSKSSTAKKPTSKKEAPKTKPKTTAKKPTSSSSKKPTPSAAKKPKSSTTSKKSTTTKKSPTTATKKPSVKKSSTASTSKKASTIKKTTTIAKKQTTVKARILGYRRSKRLQKTNQAIAEIIDKVNNKSLIGKKFILKFAESDAIAKGIVVGLHGQARNNQVRIRFDNSGMTAHAFNQIAEIII